MVTSIVLINARRDRIPETIQALMGMKGVAEVYSVTGGYDVVAILRVNELNDLSELVTKKMLKIEGIEKTNTLIAFETFSKHDLEAMFSIGME